MSLNDVHRKICPQWMEFISHLPPDSRVFFLACLFGGSHYWVFPSLTEVAHYLNKNSDETLKIMGFLLTYFTVYHDYLLCFCAQNKISALHHAQIVNKKKKTTPSIALYLHFHCWIGLFSIIH